MSNLQYQVFGSADSRDCDIMIFVPEIPSVAESRVLLAKYAEELQPLYSKEVNVNIAVINSGIVAEVFKGPPDEANNSLASTYHLHEQRFPIQIDRLVPRDAGLKALRSMRAILSFLSRTEHRAAIKQALTGTASQKHRTLQSIEISGVTDLGAKNSDLTDFYKTVAFQMGQSYLLNAGCEAYTKYEIGEKLPELKQFLGRTPVEIGILDDFKMKWLNSFDPLQIPEFEDLRK